MSAEIVDDALFELPAATEYAEEPELTASDSIWPRTERGLLNALHQRYGYVLGNGRRYVVAEHVRSDASFDARRTADFVVLDTWKSGKFSLHGHEVKISRSDWLRELKEPEKSAEFIPYLNYWWVVVPDVMIVKPAELPAMWGLMVLGGPHLRAVKPARRQAAAVMTPGRQVALMRAIQRTAAEHALRGKP